MPKEMTHWLVADRAARELEGTALGRAAARQPNLLRLGAILPDVLFYLRWPGLSRRFGRLADRIHGLDGEDTFETLAGVLAAAGRAARPDPWLALAVGLASHVFTDASFHPLVHYHSGDFCHPDRRVKSRSIQAHRRLETAVDIHLKGGLEKVRAPRLAGLIAGAEVPLPAVLTRIEWPYLGPGQALDFVRALMISLRLFSRVQTACAHPFWGEVLASGDRLPPQAGREVAALAYSRRLARQCALLDGPIAYCHPITGQELRASLAELTHRAVCRTADFCREVDCCLVKGEAPLPPGPGPSLEVDQPGVALAEASHFSPAGPLFP